VTTSPAGDSQNGERALAPCMDLYEPGARWRNTHSCDKRAGHELPHHCPLCDSTWAEPGGTVDYERAGRDAAGGEHVIPVRNHENVRHVAAGGEQ